MSSHQVFRVVLDVIGLDALKTVCKEKCIYFPDPPAQSIALPRSLKKLVDELAKNLHDFWAKEKMEKGFKYGPKDDDPRKEHHLLLPYSMLPDSENSNRDVITSTLNFVLGMGFHVRRVDNGRPDDASGSRWPRITAVISAMRLSLSPAKPPRSTGPLLPPVLRETQSESNVIGGGGKGSGDGGRRGMGRSYSQPGAASNTEDRMREIASNYHPKPINTDGVQLDKRARELKDLISENMHDTWAKGLMDKGWVYGERQVGKNQHPNMVPFVFLTDDDTKYNRDMALNVLKALEKLGWRVRQDSSTRTWCRSCF